MLITNGLMKVNRKVKNEGHMGIPDMTAIVYEFYIAPTATPEEDHDTILRLHGDFAYMAYTAGFRHYAFIRKKPLTSPKQVPGCELKIIEDRLTQLNLR